MKDLLIGASYSLVGFRYLLHPKVRNFVIIPFLINLTIFILLFYLGYDLLSTKLKALETMHLPSWLTWMQGAFSWVVIGIKWLLILVWLVLFIFIFSLIGSISANFIASPFNGLLCEKMDLHINHFTPQNRTIWKLIIDTFQREIKKWCYYIPRLILVGIFCLILHFIPIVNIFSTTLFYIFGAWMLAFQYLDFPADNRLININSLKKQLRSKKALTYGFGLSIFALTLIPFINFIILPLATLGATKLWSDHFSQI